MQAIKLPETPIEDLTVDELIDLYRQTTEREEKWLLKDILLNRLISERKPKTDSPLLRLIGR